MVSATQGSELQPPLRYEQVTTSTPTTSQDCCQEEFPSFIHSFNKHVLVTCYIPDTDPGSGATSGNKTNFLCLRGYGVNKSTNPYVIEPAVASVTEKNGTGKRRRGPRSKGAWTVYVAGSRRVTGTEAGRKWVTEPREDARGRRAQCALLCPTKQQEPTYSVAQTVSGLPTRGSCVYSATF